MKHRLMATLLAIVCASTFLGDLLACGEKFLMPTRGTRFARPPAARLDAAILIYTNPASELARTLNRLSFATALQKAGYRATLAADPAEFLMALNGRQWDLVVVDFADVQVANGDANRRAILPVSYGVSGDQLTRAKRQYPALLKAPNRARTFLDAIDTALEKRHNERTKDRQP